MGTCNYALFPFFVRLGGYAGDQVERRRYNLFLKDIHQAVMAGRFIYQISCIYFHLLSICLFIAFYLWEVAEYFIKENLNSRFRDTSLTFCLSNIRIYFFSSISTDLS